MRAAIRRHARQHTANLQTTIAKFIGSVRFGSVPYALRSVQANVRDEEEEKFYKDRGQDTTTTTTTTTAATATTTTTTTTITLNLTSTTTTTTTTTIISKQ